MRRIALIVVLLVACRDQSPPSIDGTWQGTLDGSISVLRLIVTNSSGTLNAAGSMTHTTAGTVILVGDGTLSSDRVSLYLDTGRFNEDVVLLGTFANDEIRAQVLGAVLGSVTLLRE